MSRQAWRAEKISEAANRRRSPAGRRADAAGPDKPPDSSPAPPGCTDRGCGPPFRQPAKSRGVVREDVVPTEVGGVQRKLPFPAASQDHVAMEDGVQEFVRRELGPPPPRRPDQGHLPAFSDRSGSRPAPPARARSTPGPSATRPASSGSSISTAGRTRGSPPPARSGGGPRRGRSPSPLPACHEDLGAQVPHQAQAGDQDRLRWPGRGGGQGAHRPPISRAEGGFRSGQALRNSKRACESRAARAVRPMQSARSPGAEALHLNAGGVDREHRRVAPVWRGSLPPGSLPTAPSQR